MLDGTVIPYEKDSPHSVTQEKAPLKNLPIKSKPQEESVSKEKFHTLKTYFNNVTIIYFFNFIPFIIFLLILKNLISLFKKNFYKEKRQNSLFLKKIISLNYLFFDFYNPLKLYKLNTTNNISDNSFVISAEYRKNLKKELLNKFCSSHKENLNKFKNYLKKNDIFNFINQLEKIAQEKFKEKYNYTILTFIKGVATLYFSFVIILMGAYPTYKLFIWIITGIGLSFIFQSIIIFKKQKNNLDVNKKIYKFLMEEYSKNLGLSSIQNKFLIENSTKTFNGQIIEYYDKSKIYQEIYYKNGILYDNPIIYHSNKRKLCEIEKVNNKKINYNFYTFQGKLAFIITQDNLHTNLILNNYVFNAKDTIELFYTYKNISFKNNLFITYSEKEKKFFNFMKTLEPEHEAYLEKYCDFSRDMISDETYESFLESEFPTKEILFNTSKFIIILSILFYFLFVLREKEISFFTNF